jgi:hypothetical protein
MKAYDFINQSIGSEALITFSCTKCMRSDLRNVINGKTRLWIVKLTKGGLVELRDSRNRRYVVPPRNVREVYPIHPQEELDVDKVAAG